MPAASVSSVKPEFLLTSAFVSLIAFRVKPPRLAYCSKLLSRMHPRGRRNGDHRAIAARRQQLVEGRIRRRQLQPRSGVGIVGNFEQAADEGRAAVGVSHNGNLLLLQLGQRFDLPVAGAEQQQHVVLQDRDRAGAGRYLGVGAQHRKIRLLAVELRKRLGVVGIGNDLEMQPRVGALEHGGELGGEPGLGAVGIADREDQCFGIQPDPAAPHRRDRQDHRQRGEKQHLPAVAFDNPRTRAVALPPVALGLQRSWLISGPGRFTASSWLRGFPSEIVNI